jgi:hypothetical protein
MDVSMIGLDSGRLAMVEAIADQKVFHIENTHFKSVDKVVMNNHIYSDKPLFLSWCAAQFCKLFTFFTGKNFTNSYSFMVYLMAMIFGAGINALLFYWLFRYLCRTSRGNMRLKFLFSLLCCCGSWLLSYMTIFLNHVPAALAVTGAMVSLDKYRRRKDRRAAAWAGFSAGVLFTLDFVCGAVFLAAAAAAVWFTADKETRWKHSLRCAASGACIILFSVSLNHARAEDYLRVVRPKFGAQSFDAMLRFTRDCTESVPEVIMTVVDGVTSKEEQASCRAIAESLGATLRVRPYV